jgi:arylsulfatase A-like enzyme
MFVLLYTSVRTDNQRPNVLLMFTDDPARKCLGAMGNSHIQTPNMDRIAEQGALFNKAFDTTAICCSNRACILTGQHMIRHGIRDFVAYQSKAQPFTLDIAAASATLSGDAPLVLHVAQQSNLYLVKEN